MTDQHSLTSEQSRIKTWVFTYGTRRTFAVGYSHAHSRKIRREFASAKRLWWEAKRDQLIGASLQ